MGESGDSTKLYPAAGGIVGYICAAGNLRTNIVFQMSPRTTTPLLGRLIYVMVFLHVVCISLSSHCSVRSSLVYMCIIRVHTRGVRGMSASIACGVRKSLFF